MVRLNGGRMDCPITFWHLAQFWPLRNPPSPLSPPLRFRRPQGFQVLGWLKALLAQGITPGIPPMG